MLTTTVINTRINEDRTQSRPLMNSNIFYFIYDKYLKNITINDDESGEGDSPFADGILTFDSAGYFRCTTSGLEGDLHLFIKRYYRISDWDAIGIAFYDLQIYTAKMDQRYNELEEAYICRSIALFESIYRSRMSERLKIDLICPE